MARVSKFGGDAHRVRTWKALAYQTSSRRSIAQHSSNDGAQCRIESITRTRNVADDDGKDQQVLLRGLLTWEVVALARLQRRIGRQRFTSCSCFTAGGSLPFRWLALCSRGRGSCSSR